jgi:hypothetical protein
MTRRASYSAFASWRVPDTGSLTERAHAGPIEFSVREAIEAVVMRRP